MKYKNSCKILRSPSVTTCVVVWIEIVMTALVLIMKLVTTCVVVWIEINGYFVLDEKTGSHHLRGGVD